MSKEQVDVDTQRSKVVVGMPVYNGEDYIKTAIDAILAQDYDDFELVISDNASTDSTEDICRAYAAADSRVRYVRQSENIGALPNFLYLLHNTDSKYFMWAAIDDSWKPNCLSRYVSALDNHPDAVLVFSHWKTFSHTTGESRANYASPSVEDSVRGRLLTRLLNPVPGLIYGLFVRDVLKDIPIGNYDYADLFLTYCVAVKGKILIENDCLYSAGVKGDKRIPKSLHGKRVRYRRFFVDSWRLLGRHLSFFDKAIFRLILVRQVLHCIKNVRLKGY